MEDIKWILERLSVVKIADLERKEKNFSFSDVYKLITVIFENTKDLQNNPDFWNQLSKDKINHIRSCLKDFLRQVETIENFAPAYGQGNPQSIRDEMANNILRVYNEFDGYLFPRLKLFVLEKEMSSKKVEMLVKQAEETLSTIKQQKKRIDEIMKTLREASAAAGVSKFAGVFEKQAEQNKKTAIAWLVVSAISAVVIGIFLWQIFDQLTNVINANDDGVNFQISLQVFLTKILFLSFFSVIFFQVVKNYNANMHLFTLNKHRENSMRSFESFVQSTEDPKIRDTVLIQATKAIFEAGESGYVASKEGTITGMETIKIVDQIKGKSSD